MTSIWDEGALVHCAGPPGVPPAAGGDGFQPNCWGGIASRLTLNITRYPMIALGVNNFCIELWHKSSNLSGDWNGPRDDCTVGYWKTPVNVGNNMTAYQWFKQAAGGFDRSVYDTDVPALQVFNATADVADWHHHVVNFDRAGNMQLWRDGVQTDFVAINNVNLGTAAFAPWVGTDGDEAFGWTDYHDSDLADWNGFAFFNGIVGPVATHVGTLLTVGQMRDSMERRYVNLLAQTQVLFDWREPLNVQGWDGDRSHIVRGISSYATTPIAAPEGNDGTIIVPDLSGNDNDWILTTRPAYNATGVSDFATNTTGLSCCAFASDPFFQHGGMP